MRATLALAPLVLWPAIARADDVKLAADHFREGRHAFDAHEYTRAALEFEAANKAKPAGAALVSAGLAWELAGDILHAALDLSSAIDVGGLEPRDEASARTHLADIDKKVGYVEVFGPTGARLSIDGHEEGALPMRVRLMPGDHRIEARTADGATVRRRANVAAGETVPVDATIVVERPQPQPASPPLQRTIGWIGVGAGASLFVAGAIVGGVGLSARDDFVSGGTTSLSLHDEAIALRTAANVLWVSAGVLGVVGVVLVLTAPRAKVVIGANGVGMAVQF